MGCNTSSEAKPEKEEGQRDTTNKDKEAAAESKPAASEEQAATKIQAVFRGHKTRKTMSVKNQQAPEPEPTRAELEAEFRADDKELCNAATKIQASFRGHQSRKQVEMDVKEAKDKDKVPTNGNHAFSAPNEIEKNSVDKDILRKIQNYLKKENLRQRENVHTENNEDSYFVLRDKSEKENLPKESYGKEKIQVENTHIFQDLTRQGNLNFEASELNRYHNKTELRQGKSKLEDDVYHEDRNATSRYMRQMKDKVERQNHNKLSIPNLSQLLNKITPKKPNVPKPDTSTNYNNPMIRPNSSSKPVSSTTHFENTVAPSFNNFAPSNYNKPSYQSNALGSSNDFNPNAQNYPNTSSSPPIPPISAQSSSYDSNFEANPNGNTVNKILDPDNDINDSLPILHNTNQVKKKKKFDRQIPIDKEQMKPLLSNLTDTIDYKSLDDLVKLLEIHNQSKPSKSNMHQVYSTSNPEISTTNEPNYKLINEQLIAYIKSKGLSPAGILENDLPINPKAADTESENNHSAIIKQHDSNTMNESAYTRPIVETAEDGNGYTKPKQKPKNPAYQTQSNEFNQYYPRYKTLNTGNNAMPFVYQYLTITLPHISPSPINILIPCLNIAKWGNQQTLIQCQNLVWQQLVRDYYKSLENFYNNKIPSTVYEKQLYPSQQYVRSKNLEHQQQYLNPLSFTPFTQSSKSQELKDLTNLAAVYGKHQNIFFRSNTDPNNLNSKNEEYIKRLRLFSDNRGGEFFQQSNSFYNDEESEAHGRHLEELNKLYWNKPRVQVIGMKPLIKQIRAENILSRNDDTIPASLIDGEDVSEEELDIDLTDPELNKAATKIQASFRGHKVRKEVDN